MLVEQRYDQESSAINVSIINPKQPTREELLQLIKEREEDIASLHAEIDKLEKYKSYADMADEMKAMHSAFVNSGFSDEQAFEMLKMMMKPAMNIAAQTVFMR